MHTQEPRRDALYDQSQALVGQLAIITMRTPSVLSAASVAALLAFFSANISIVSNHQILLISIIADLMIALFLSSISTLPAYFSQYYISKGLGKGEAYTKYPLEASKENEQSWIKRGLRLQILTKWLVCISYLFIAVGFLSFILLLSKVW